MAKKMLRKQRIAIRKLEERVLFDAAGAAEIVEAAQAADAAAQAADAQDGQDGDSSSDEQNGAVTAPPEDASSQQENAETEVQAASGAEAAENAADAVNDDASFDPAASLADNTELADSLTDAADADDAVPQNADDIMPQDSTSDTSDDADSSPLDGDAADDSAAADSSSDDGDDAVAFADAFAAENDAVSETRELVILSDYVKDQDKIIAQLAENTDVLVLKRGEDPLDQINEYLDSQDGVQYSAVHVVSHGNAGYFLLNDAVVDARAVADDPAGWRAIGEHLTSDGDIMIYGCNVAGSEDGRAMISAIADLTGADVGASAEKVGSAGWDLEYAYGIVDTQNIVIDGVSWDLGSYTVFHVGGGGLKWTESTGSDHTTWYFLDGGSGQLIRRDWVNEGWSDIPIDRSGNESYCVNAAAAADADTITITSYNVAGSTSTLGDITAAMNGGLTISVESGVTASASVGVMTGGLDITGGGNFAFNSAVDIVNGATLEVSGSTVRFGGGATLNGGTLSIVNGTISGGTVDINSDFTVAAGRTLTIGSGATVNVNNETNALTFALNGTIAGAGILNFQTAANGLAGSGTIDMTGRVNYRGGITGTAAGGTLYNTYLGNYGTLGLTLSQDIILRDDFLASRSVGTLAVNGDFDVTMSGAFSGVTTSAEVNDAAFIYNEEGVQHILGGTYDDLTVTGTSLRYLLADIDVNGTMTLGTTLNTEGHDVYFHNEVLDGTSPGRIYATQGTVTYAVTPYWTSTFFGGTYGNLRIGGAAVNSGDNVNFLMNQDAAITGVLGAGVALDHPCNLTVTVSKAIESVGRIQLQNASLNVTGTIGGNISNGISAVKEAGFTGNPTLSFSHDLGNVGGVALNGYTAIFTGRTGNLGNVAITGGTAAFNGEVGGIADLALGNVIDPGTGAVTPSTVTFNDAVTIAGNIASTGANTFNFNGATAGNGSIFMERGTVNYNYDGNQTVYHGTYNDLSIDGTGVKTVSGDTLIGGTFNGNESGITIASGTFSFSTLAAHTLADPHRPAFTVNSGATLRFMNPNTGGIEFYGTVDAYGTVDFSGRGNYHGRVTVESGGAMTVDDAAINSVFGSVVNRGNLSLGKALTISSLHNYGVLTVTNTDVALDVYNHASGTLVFNLTSGSMTGGVYQYVFARNESQAEGAGNRLINGGAVSVTAGTLRLNGFTQGDRNAEYGEWSYGSEAYNVGSGATLVLNTAAFNTGNTNPPGNGALLGNITNAGTFELGVGVTLDGDVINAEGSTFVTANAPVTFRGAFTHDGTLVTAAGNTGAALTFNGAVSGNGTVAGTAGGGYDGTVYYAATQASQRIIDGDYNNTVFIAGADKTVEGNVIFNAEVRNAATIGGTGSVTFNGNTRDYSDRVGRFTGSVNATYSAAAGTVYAGAYGDLVIASGTGANGRTVNVALTAASLSLSGDNVFTAQNDAAEDIVLTVNGALTLAAGSNTTFRALAGAAVISGGDGGTVEFASSDMTGATVDHLLAGASYTSAADQTVLAGSYRTLTLMGGMKSVTSNVSVSGVLTATANTSTVISGEGIALTVSGTAAMGAVTVTGNAALSITGGAAIDTIRVDYGSNLNLTLGAGAHRLGTVDPASGGVTLGGTLTVDQKYGENGTLNIYSWTDQFGSENIATGNIRVEGGVVNFVAGDGYGPVGANLMRFDGEVNDPGSRLQNWWITIDGNENPNQFTLTLPQNYSASSKFLLKGGVHLTVNGFRNDPVTDDPITGVAAFWLTDNSQLIIAEDASVGDLTVDRGSTVVFDDDAALETFTVTGLTRLADGNLGGSGETIHAVAGAGNVVFAGTDTVTGNTGDGTFAMTGGSVDYAENLAVYGGTYYGMTLNGSTVETDITVTDTTIVAGNSTFNGAVTFNGSVADSGNVNVTLNGAVNGTGSFNFDGTGIVTYHASGSGQNVLAGTYGNLVLTGGTSAAQKTYSLLGNITVETDVTVSSYAVLTASGTFGATLHNTLGGGHVNMGNGTTVTYAANGSNVYGGTYGNLVLAGAGTFTAIDDMVINGDAAVQGSAVFAGQGASDTNHLVIDFNGTTSGDGTASFGVFTDANYAESANILAGTYAALTVTGAHTVSGNIDVSGAATFNGGVQSGAGTWTFRTSANGDGTVNSTGTVVYGVAFAGNAFNGVYNNLEVQKTDPANPVVFDDITLNGTLSGQGNAKFTSQIRLGNNAAANMEPGSTVTYDWGVGGDLAENYILKGTYGNLILAGHVLNFTEGFDYGYNYVYSGHGTYRASGDTTVNGTLTIQRYAKLSSDGVGEGTLTFTISGTPDKLALDDVEVQQYYRPNKGIIEMGDGTTVVYKSGVNVYAGIYHNVTFEGNADVYFYDITVNGTATVGGTLTGGGHWTFNGSMAGAGRLDNTTVYLDNVGDDYREDWEYSYDGYRPVTETGEPVYIPYNRVTVGAGFTGALLDGSSYSDLEINSANGASSGALTLNGTLSGVGTITFTGKNTWGDNAQVSYASGGSHVSAFYNYTGNDGATVLRGEYNDLTLNGAHTIDSAVTVHGAAELATLQTVAAQGVLTFAGTTNAAGLFESEALRISGSQGGRVVYGDHADVFQGSYHDLELNSGVVRDGQLGYHSEKQAGGDIVVNGTFSLTTEGVLAGGYSFILNGSAANVTRMNQTGGVMTYGNGVGVVTGSYNDLTLRSGIDADHVLTYLAGGDVTVNGFSAIGKYAVFAAQGSSEIVVNGETFTLEEGTRGYSRVWHSADQSQSVLYRNGHWELLNGEDTVDHTVDSSIDPFGTVWQSGGLNFVTGNMVTVSFLGTTNALDADSGTVNMGSYSATEYGPNAAMYAGSYFRFHVERDGADVLFSELPANITVTDELIVDVGPDYYFVFDGAVSEFDLSITIHGDIWYTNAFLASSDPFGGSFAGSIRLGGVYDADHESAAARTAYTEDVLLSGVTITGDNKYIDAVSLRGLLSIENSNYSGTNFQLRVNSDLSQRAGIEYRGESAVMALYAWSEEAGDYVVTAYDRLILDGEISVPYGSSIEVVGELVFREDALLGVSGDFTLGSAASNALLTADVPYTSYIIGAGTADNFVDLHIGDNTVVPILLNIGNGAMNLTAGDNVAIAAQNDTASGGSIGLAAGTAGAVNITAGSDFTVNGLITAAGGTLNMTAGNNAALKGASLQVTGTADIDLGNGAVVNGSISVSGVLNLSAADVKLKGASAQITGQAVFDLGSDSDAATSTVANDIFVTGSAAALEIAGNNVSFQGFVNVWNGGTLTVTGSNVGFTNDVLNYYVGTIGTGTYSGSGYKWIHDYLFSDASYYNYYDYNGNSASGPYVPTAPAQPGTITIASSGKVTFSELVVSGGTFNISSGNVFFNAEFAVAGGSFNITGGTVTFAHDVYVSAVYGTGVEPAAETYFNVTGGSVTISGSLYNWVRIPVGYFSKNDSNPLGYAGPFWKDSSSNIHLDPTLNSSHVVIGGDAQVTVTGNVSNVGVWGKTEFLLQDTAQVTVRGNLAVYSESESGFWSGSEVKYDYLTNLMGFSTGFTGSPSDRANATFPVKPEYPGSTEHTYFTIDGDARLQVEGETWSGATYSTSGGAWGTTSGGKGWTVFTINSSDNKFTGLFTNSSHFYVNGSGNSFGDVQSNYFMYVNDTNSFGTITNYQDLKITNPGAVVLSLVNEGGKVWITGDADGFVFANELTVHGGYVSIESEFGVDISSPVSVSDNGELVFSARNTLADTVEVTSGKLTFAGEAGGSRLKDVVTIGESGTLNVSTGDSQVIFDSDIFNAGNFVVDGSISVGGVVTNSGKLTVSKISTFSGELRNITGGNVLVAAPAAGTSFAAVSNAGAFTNAANNVAYNGDFSNSGTFVNNNGVDASFSGGFANSGVMKIDGTITVPGLFTNTSNDVFVYGIADFGATVNSGTIYLEPLTGAHAATVKFGDLENNGTITSRNDSRNAGDIYFKGTTTGTGSIEGFTGTLYYAYTGTEDIVQSFYANSKYNEVTVYIGNRSATGEDYSHGLATLTENLSFKSLIIDGGNLAIGDAGHTITVDASSFVERTAGTITVNAGSALTFSSASGTTFTSSLHNFGRVESAGDLVLNGTTAGDGTVRIADGHSITYAYNGTGSQTLFGFTGDSATNLIIKGSRKVIAVDMALDSLVNEQIGTPLKGADIFINKGVTLTLGAVSGDANAGADLFTVFTEAGDAETAGGRLEFASGILNAAIDNAGSVAVAATDDVTLGGTITSSGEFTVAAGAFAVALTGTVANSGSFSAGTAAGGSVTFGGAVANDDGGTFDADASSGGSVTFNGAVVNYAGGTFTATDANFNSTFFQNQGRFTVSAVNTPVTVVGPLMNYGTFIAEGADGTNTVSFTYNVINADGTFNAVNSSFSADVNITDGAFNVGENVSWAGQLVNLGTVTIASETFTIGSVNTVWQNGGTIEAAEGTTLSFDAAMTLGGTILIDSGATLSVDAQGTIVDPTAVLPDTTGGVKLTGLLVNAGTVRVSVSGSYDSVLDVAALDNGDADSASALDIGAYGNVVVRSSTRVDGNNNPIIYGDVAQDPNGHLYFNGKINFLSVNVTVGSGTLSGVLGSIDPDKFNHVGINVTETAASGDVEFTVDKNSGANVSYNITGGAELILDVDESLQSTLPLKVEGAVEADADSTVRNATDETELSGAVSIDGTLVNAGGAVTVSGNNAGIAAVDNGSGTVTVNGSGSTVGTVANGSGTVDAAGNSIAEVSANAGNVLAGDITAVSANNGTVTATAGDIGAVGTNNGTVTATAGDVGSIGTNAAGATVTAGGDVGTVGTNNGSMTVAGDVSSIGTNAAGATVTAGGSIGSVTTNASGATITADAGVGDVGENAGDITVNGNNAVIGDVNSNSGSFTVNGNDADVGKVVTSGTFTVNGSDADIEKLDVAAGGNAAINGNGTDIEEVAVAAGGNVTVDGDNADFDQVTVSSGGNVTVNGDNAGLENVDNGGSFTVNGSGTTFENFGNSGSAVVNGDLTAQNVANSGDFEVSATGSLNADNVGNSGNFTVSGSGSRIGALSNSGNFSLAGSDNSVASASNSGSFNFSSGNSIGKITNTGTGTVDRDGVIWMMASDEGMNPQLFSNGMNQNFSVLSYLAENILSDSALTENAVFPEIGAASPAAAGSVPGSQSGLLSDLNADASGIDMLDIDSEVDELIFGDTPALGDDELEDVLSGDGSSGDFEEAIGEVVGK